VRDGSVVIAGYVDRSSLATETAPTRSVRVTDDALVVELRDGRSVSAPLTWFLRLAEGRPSERRKWELIGPGIGIHWPDLDEDISVEDLLDHSLAECGTAAGSLTNAELYFVALV
jgi:hypothetical protein